MPSVPKMTSTAVLSSCVSAITLVIVIQATPNVRKCLRGASPRRILHYLADRYLSNSEPTSEPDHVRDAFQSTPLLVVRPLQGHAHGVSAANRSTATLTSERIISNLGLNAFFFQRGRCDERAGRSGNRSWFWAKDFATTPVIADPAATDVVVHIDTDYYVDMPQQLVDHFAPHLIYTFQPDAAAAVRSDYSYTFDEKSVLHYHVHGSAAYEHSLWAYDTDCVTVVDRCLGIPTALATYLVDRRRVSEDHYLVMLTPVRKWTGWQAMLAYYSYSHSELRRMSNHSAGYTRIMLIGDGDHRISTARCGTFTAATTTVAVDDTIRNLIQVSKYELTIPSVEAAVASHAVDQAMAQSVKQTAALLTAFHRSQTPARPAVVYPVAQSLHRYQFGTFEPDAKPSMLAFMSPFLHEAYAPDRTRGNDQRGVSTRITDVRSDTELTPLVSKIMDDFVRALFPEVGSLRPTDHDEVMDRQDRPTQRQLLAQATSLTAHLQRIVRAFVKTEAHAKPADPRLISTINPVDKDMYSRYIYPLSEYIKGQVWYAFGMKPSDIAQRVVDVCANARTVTKTDFSRFDGTVSPVLRELERRVLNRAYGPAHHGALRDLHGSQYNLRATTTFGVKYDTGTARASGSPETATFNSIDNAFAAYLGTRCTRINGTYTNHATAWAKLQQCIFGGDDGLSPDIDVDAYTKACESIGLRVKCDPVTRGRFGVMFLARAYSPDVWFGDQTSCCDIRRQLGKLHVTGILPSTVTPWDKAVQKARAFALSDANTPVLGPWAARVVRLAEGYVCNAESESIKPYSTKYAPEAQYPNDASEWMTWYARECGLDLDTFEAWFQGAWTPQALLLPPCLDEPRPPTVVAPVVIDQTSHLPPPATAAVAAAPAGTPPLTKLDNYIAALGLPIRERLNKHINEHNHRVLCLRNLPASNLKLRVVAEARAVVPRVTSSPEAPAMSTRSRSSQPAPSQALTPRQLRRQSYRTSLQPEQPPASSSFSRPPSSSPTPSLRSTGASAPPSQRPALAPPPRVPVTPASWRSPTEPTPSLPVARSSTTTPSSTTSATAPGTVSWSADRTSSSRWPPQVPPRPTPSTAASSTAGRA
jgi:hypothetical protein